ncbi:hypothetical protein Dsin_032170 [Dipteronia sinensis]|uniref:BED-type domain-containing protein n=1 Tax=Dipteronia sinensis TaxID=43782 RepID=A0AAD9ZP71_9ROSI|nr:hypothetical protein Dsin_032170 [Dipteronia sinensis]
MDETFDFSLKSEPYDTVSEGSSAHDSQDGGLVSKDGEPEETEEVRHQSGSPGKMSNNPCNKIVAGTNSIKEDQLNKDNRDDNVGMEDEDIAVSHTEEEKRHSNCEAPNDNLKQSPTPKKSKDIMQGADPKEKVRKATKPDKGNATKRKKEREEEVDVDGDANADEGELTVTPTPTKRNRQRRRRTLSSGLHSSSLQQKMSMSDVPRNSSDSIATPSANTVESENDQAPLWQYVTKLERSGKGGGNIPFKCNFCQLTYKGSYYRVKSHLLKVK